VGKVRLYGKTTAKSREGEELAMKAIDLHA
jgi:hypothetical protein